ncbi:MAG: AarF/UbiB family protein [Syntrophorhabdales bacterium]
MTVLKARVTRHDLRRYRQILGILARYGFGDLLGRIRATYRVRWRTRSGKKKAQGLAGLSTPERLRLAFEELGPTFIKFGQILSCRPDLLPPEFIKQMSKLQDCVPPFPYEEAKAVIEAELGRSLSEIFQSMDEEPVAAASLAQVYRARTKTGDEVAVKVQRPGVEAVIGADIRILYELATLAERHLSDLRYYEPTRMVDEFARTIRRELDFAREGRNIDRFRQYFARDETVHIPKVFWDNTAQRILTTEYIRGIKISDAEQIDAAGLDRREIAINGANLILKEVFQHRFFHADPHPGNIFVLGNNVIAPVDFGMTGTIDEETADHMSAMLSAIVARDVNGLIDTLLALGVAEGLVDRKALKAELTDLIDRYYGVPLKDVSIKTAMDEHMTIIRKYRLRPPGDLIMMARALLLSEGVARMLYPQFNIVEHARPYARRVLARGLDPARELRELARATRDGVRLAKRMPAEVGEILSKLRKDEIAIGIEHRGLERFITELDRSSNRLSFAVVIAALIVGSSIVFQTGVGPTLFGYPPPRPCGLSPGEHPRHVASRRHHSLGEAVVSSSVL